MPGVHIFIILGGIFAEFIREWIRLEGIIGGYGEPPCSSRDITELITQDGAQVAFEYL